MLSEAKIVLFVDLLYILKLLRLLYYLLLRVTSLIWLEISITRRIKKKILTFDANIYLILRVNNYYGTSGNVGNMKSILNFIWFHLCWKLSLFSNDSRHQSELNWGNCMKNSKFILYSMRLKVIFIHLYTNTISRNKLCSFIKVFWFLERCGEIKTVGSMLMLVFFRWSYTCSGYDNLSRQSKPISEFLLISWPP